MNVIESIARRVLQSATVTYKEQISANTYHIRISGEGLEKMEYRPGENLRVFVGMGQPTSLKEKVRTYSVWNYDAAEKRIDLAANILSSGPGATWARDVQPGDTVYFAGPKGRFTVDDSGDFYIFIGDISALAHLYEIRRNLQPGKKTYGIIYSPEEKDFFFDIDGKAPFNFYKMPLNATPLIIQELSYLSEEFSGRGIVYIAGDVRICRELYRHFRFEFRWSPRRVKTKPFWDPGKTGLE